MEWILFGNKKRFSNIATTNEYDNFIQSVFKKPLCAFCNDTGFVTKDEWYGDDESVSTELLCACNEE